MLVGDLLYLGDSITITKEWVLGQLGGQRAEGGTRVEG